MTCPYCGGRYWPGMSVIGHLLAHAHKETRIEPAEIRGPARERNITHVRFAIMSVARSRGLSTPQIGRALGDRDHTTILHGLKRAKQLSATPEFRALLTSLEEA